MHATLLLSATITFTTVFASIGFSDEIDEGRAAVAQITFRQSSESSKSKGSNDVKNRAGELRKLAGKVEAYRILPTQAVKDQVIYEIGQMPEKKQTAYLNELAKHSLDEQKVKIHVLIQSAFDKINKLPTPDERVAGLKKYREKVSAFVNAGKPSAGKPTPNKAAGQPVAGTRMIFQQVPQGTPSPRTIRASYYMDAEQAKELAKFLAVHTPGVAASADGNTLTIHATADKIAAFRSFYSLLRGETKPAPQLYQRIRSRQGGSNFGGANARRTPGKIEAPKETEEKKKKKEKEVKEKKKEKD